MAMETSLFAAFIDKYFRNAIQTYTERYNGKKTEDQYLYESMLTPESTVDLTWSSSTLNHSIPAADVVSLDSSLPLKKRSTLRLASGDIAKIGIKYQMKEKTLTDISIMRAKGQREQEIAEKILNNVPRAINGVKVRLDILFQQALSTGQVLVANDDNDGTGVRASFGYSDSHIFHAKAAKWSDTANAIPLEDIRQLIDQASADSDTLTDFYISDTYFNLMRKTNEVKALVASARNQVVTDASLLPPAGRQATIDALGDEFNAAFHIVNSSYRIEDVSGKQTTIKPWAQGNVVGVTSSTVGRLVYGTLAEELNPVAGVTYQKSDYILVSEYSHNEPSLAEFTSAQTLALPVIDDGDSVYVLHADSTGNALSVDPTAVDFTAKRGTKEVNVHSDVDFTVSVPTEASWLTAKRSGNVVALTAAANSSGAERTASVTVTDSGSASVTVTVKQSA